MAYTQEDLNNVSAAITSLLLNQRRVSCTIQGNRIEYAPVDLPQLRAIRSEIQSEISYADGALNYVLVQTGKGI